MRHEKKPELDARINELLDLLDAAANAALDNPIEEHNALSDQLATAQKDVILTSGDSAVAEDCENLLRIIKGYAALVGYRALVPDKLPESSSTSSEAIDHGAEVSRQVMALVPMDEESAVTNTDEVASEMSRLLHGIFLKTIALGPELEIDLARILADERQITRALLSFSVNARSNIPLRGHLSIRTNIVDRSYTRNLTSNDERYVCVELTSTGVGTEVAVREPFFTTAGTAEGAKIGLSIVYALVKKHNGFIDVETEPGHGGTARLCLPLRPIGKQTFAEGIAGGMLSTRSTAARGTVLLVEEQRTPAALKDALRHSGYNVLVALDGAQAMELHHRYRNTIDVMLLDLNLPKISAWHVIARVKEESPNVKVIVASGYIEPAFKSKMAGAGVKEFVEKPYVEEDLIQLVRFLMSEKTSPEKAGLTSLADA